MYILTKQLPFLPSTTYYYADTPGDGRFHCLGTFKKPKAKVFKYRLAAWLCNLRFRGIIQKIEPSC